jgi:hypothetical protein
MKRLPLFVVGAALLAPAPALASGVVVKVQRASHLVAVANTKGHVSLVRTAAASRLRVGQRVDVASQRLANGVLRASTVHVVGRSNSVRFRGRLLLQSSSRLVLSAGGAVISLHSAARTSATARDDRPRVGSTVEVQATVNDDDDLDEDAVRVIAPTTPGGTIEGRLTLGVGTITVSSEHLTLVLKVTAGLDLSAFRTGDEVLATFTQGADGSLTLTRLATDDDGEDTAQGGEGGHGGGDGGDDGGGD